LFLGGFWLDDNVTFAALGALADGYDVHVMLDVAVARREEAREAAIERLIQAGVVPTTAVQVVSEWATTIESADTRNRLHKILSEDLS
jgi:nicotinamidase-related amidase